MAQQWAEGNVRAFVVWAAVVGWGGRQVLVAGTGFWAHRTFNATVVDVRSSDDTIKVQFPDKGYKRYPREEFEKLRVGKTKGGSTFGAGSERLFELECPEVRAGHAAPEPAAAMRPD